jgi:hypothetical protein
MLSIKVLFKHKDTAGEKCTYVERYTILTVIKRKLDGSIFCTKLITVKSLKCIFFLQL